MKRKSNYFNVLIISLLSFLLVNIVTGQESLNNSVPNLSESLQKKIDQKVDSILPLLTIKEKVALCHAQSKFSSKGVERLGIPELWLSDGPHGVRAEIQWDSWAYAGFTNDSVTAFPALTCLAATFNPELSGEYGFSVGEEARYRKKDILLGPGVNIYRTPMNGRNFEYMGEDPYLASKMVVPYIKGVQKNGVAACVKHFALNNQEKWRNHINTEISERALREIYLPAFKAAITEGNALSIMGAYNKIRGVYCCENDYLLNKILKDEWGFDGVVVSDWGAVHSTKSATAGLDIEMGTGTGIPELTTTNYYDSYHLADSFLKAIEEGEIDIEVLNDKARRILRLMLYTTMSNNRPLGRKNTNAHHDVARSIANEGIVLLKNENSLFPVKDEKGIIIAVIGENAVKPMTIGGGSSELKAQFEISPLEGLKNRYKNAKVKFTRGYGSGKGAWDRVLPSPYNADSLIQEAIKLAKEADIVLFVGGLNKNFQQDCEGNDRINFGLPFGQPELLNDIYKVNKNIGVILISGNAVEMPWNDKVKGIMQAWYLGSMTGAAIADIVSGDVNPSGKLPFSFPVKLEDNAAISFGSSSYPGDSINQQYKEDILVGYRWFDTKKIKPLFAFGYGLSYTSFELSKIKTDSKRYKKEEQILVTCEITNTGDEKGAEVVQVYVGKPDSKVERPLKELKGFAKIEVEKGETKVISIPVKVKSFAYYDEGSQSWKTEKGSYMIYVGTSSDKIIKKLKVRIE